MYASRKGSGKTAQICRLARVMAGGGWDECDAIHAVGLEIQLLVCLPIRPYFMYASSKGSGKTAQMCRLARVLTAGWWDECDAIFAVRLEIKVLVQVFVYAHISCMQAEKTLARLHGCVGLPESWLVADGISVMLSMQWGSRSKFWSKSSSTSILHVCKQKRLWKDCTDEQAGQSLDCWLIRWVWCYPCSEARDPSFGPSLHLLLYFMYASRKDSGKTAQMCRFARVIA